MTKVKKTNMWGCTEPCKSRKINGKPMMVGSRVRLRLEDKTGYGTVIRTGCSYGHFPTIKWDDGTIDHEFTFIRGLEIITDLRVVSSN